MKISETNERAIRDLMCDKLDQIEKELNNQMFDRLARDSQCDRKTLIAQNCKIFDGLHRLYFALKYDD